MLQKLTEEGSEFVSAVKKRFSALNRERLARTQASLRERQRDFLDLLPLLFHSNHALLPGFITKETPAGISDFSPPKSALDIARKLTKSFEFKRRALSHYDILALYLMGSSGTVAYSKKSDFDIWICHKDDISVERLHELRRKADAISRWAEELELEVHFFLIEPESFKQGTHDDISAESSGSAQHFLLMEEFYRTGLLLAGRYPLWWLVPPDAEHRYDEFVADLKRKRFLREDEGIDFGALPGVPAEEFFGAALWQLYKGIDSPYKSVLKLLLMEVYAAEYPNIELLSQRFKTTIYNGEINLDVLDPYIMLYRKIEEYLLNRNEAERLDLVRRCFYFKVNEPLSKPVQPRHMTWRRELMQLLIQSWEWPEYFVLMLDSRTKWKIQQVLQERNVLVNALTYSYKFLSDFAREHAQLALINQRDLNILGRKLYAAFERKAGKVEIVNRGISEDLWESHLSFYQAKAQGSGENWLLYGGLVNVTEVTRLKPLKRAYSLVELMAWCHFNSLIDSTTSVALFALDGGLSIKHVRELIGSFQRTFPKGEALGASMEDLNRRARVTRMAIFINLGIDPNSMHGGNHIASNRTDALSYGGLHQNLALTFDQVTLTSWKEVLTSRYSGVDGLMSCLRDYLRWSSPAENIVPLPVSAYCFSFGRGRSIAHRIEELFGDVVSCFYGGASRVPTRYLMAVEHIFYAIYFEQDTLRYDRIDNYVELQRYLSAGWSAFTRIVVDKYALAETPLALIFSMNKPRVVQLFYLIDGADADVYVLDEKGSFFQQRMLSVDSNMLLHHFSLFFNAISHRQYFEISGEAGHSSVDGVEFFEILHERARNWHLSKRQAIRQRAHAYFNVQVIGNLVAGAKPIFSIFCDHYEFTSLEHGVDIFDKVAKHILKRRRSGERYPIYITDIDLPITISDGQGVGSATQTVHLLQHKKNIEAKLNEALLRVNEFA